MSVSLKGVYLSILNCQFISNDECAIVKEAQDA